MFNSERCKRLQIFRSRQELSNEYCRLVTIYSAEFGFDTAEKGLLKICQKLAKRWRKVRMNIGRVVHERHDAAGDAPDASDGHPRR